MNVIKENKDTEKKEDFNKNKTKIESKNQLNNIKQNDENENCKDKSINNINELKEGNTKENEGQLDNENLENEIKENKLKDLKTLKELLNDNLEIKQESFMSEFFFIKKKRLLEIKKIFNSNSSKSFNKKKNKSNQYSFKSNKKSEKNSSININELECNYSNESYENNDYIKSEQNSILEEMFIEAQKSEKENQLDLYLDIINLDETKKKIWSYKCYEEICLIYIESEQHEKFLKYYIKLRETAHFLEENEMKVYIKNTAEKFVKEIVKKSKESMNHWLEDISKDFNISQEDKIINTFEANINLNFLLIYNQTKKNKEKKEKDEDDRNGDEKKFDINIIEYMQDKQELEELTNNYLIKECGCDPKYLDSRGNTFFYFSPNNSKRGGEKYNIPVGWTAFGIEVLNRYGNDDWLANDGREGEWVVAYHGFGRYMSGDNLKNLIKIIIHDNLRPGSGQACCHSKDKRHPGKICGNGVYITPNIEIALGYAGFVTLGDKTYNIVIMVRANPKFIREPEGELNYWIIDGKADQLRPYRLLIKENKNYFRDY